MAGSKNLKQKLKAANKRRAKRSQAANTAHPASKAALQPPADAVLNDVPRVDVVGKLCHILLEDQTLNDQTAIRSLRRCLKTRENAEDSSEPLASKLNRVQQQPGVSLRSYRDALSDLLEIAQQHQTTNSPNSFLRYLSVLNG